MLHKIGTPLPPLPVVTAKGVPARRVCNACKCALFPAEGGAAGEKRQVSAGGGRVIAGGAVHSTAVDGNQTDRRSTNNDRLEYSVIRHQVVIEGIIPGLFTFRILPRPNELEVRWY